jgi:hypothetical protein
VVVVLVVNTLKLYLRLQILVHRKHTLLAQVALAVLRVQMSECRVEALLLIPLGLLLMPEMVEAPLLPHLRLELLEIQFLVGQVGLLPLEHWKNNVLVETQVRHFPVRVVSQLQRLVVQQGVVLVVGMLLREMQREVMLPQILGPEVVVVLLQVLLALLVLAVMVGQDSSHLSNTCLSNPQAT